MLSIQNILNEIATIISSYVSVITPKKIIFVVDSSGSTGLEFAPKIDVLNKELSIVHKYILENPHNNYRMYSFASSSADHGPINVIHDEGIVNLPKLKQSGCTTTHLPFVEINKKVNQYIPDIVILVTDGETDSSATDIQRQMELFTKNNIKLEIIAVSAKNIDMNVISGSEESRIPGMDILYLLANNVSKLTIYNQFHKDTPYEGSTSSDINIGCITFMGYKITGHINAYINVLLTQLEAHQANINWGVANINFKKMVVEIGKLLTVYFVHFPMASYVINPGTGILEFIETEHFFVNMIITKLCAILGVADITPEHIYKLIKYGFDCTKAHTPFMFTNLDEHIKTHNIKHSEFKSSIETLKHRGTTLGSTKTICMPVNGVCIINNECILLTENFGSFLNSRDKFKNVYFGCDDMVDRHATRIALGELCTILGLKEPTHTFYVLSEMLLMYIKGVDLDLEHMKELRKLAIIQTSIESMIAPNKYDGMGLYRQWKAKQICPINYVKPTVFHSSLFVEPKINQLKLDEQLWWAAMMCMLGLFEEQKHNYQSTLTTKGVNTQDEFLNWLRTTYADTVCGSIRLYTASPTPISVFTLCNFDETDEVFELMRHGPCNTHTHYSRDEIESYVIPSGCVWCRYNPTWADFKRVHINNADHTEQINALLQTSSRLHVPNNIVIEQIIDTNVGTDVSVGVSSFVSGEKILINMIGITGAGKSTISKKIYDLVKKKRGACLIISADKWLKKGKSHKQLQSAIKRELVTFENKVNKHKVIIVDNYNENNLSANCVGYTTFNFYPNLDKTQYNLYECWCLRNVLMRPLYKKTDSYWLNPESEGISTCIKIHNQKSTTLKQLLSISNTITFNESITMDSAMALVGANATTYETYLATQNLDDIIIKFIKSTGFPL